MSTEVARQLRLIGRRVNITVSTVLAKAQSTEVELVQCAVSPVGKHCPSIPLHHVHVVPDLHIDNTYIVETGNISNWSHLASIPKPDCEIDLKKVGLLIGEYTPEAHIVLEARYGSDVANEPYGIVHY